MHLDKSAFGLVPGAGFSRLHKDRSLIVISHRYESLIMIPQKLNTTVICLYNRTGTTTLNQVYFAITPSP